MTFLKSFVLAATIALASVSANAAVTSSADLDSFSDSEFYTFNSIGTVGSSFSDYLALSVLGNRDLVGSVSATSTGKIAFTAFDLVASDLSVLSFGTLTSAGPRLAFGGLESLASAGSYFIHIAGTSTGTAGYNGTLSLVSPVPEPEAGAMMLVGLGLMGFVARRRKSKM
jgi:hypothetical protein